MNGLGKEQHTTMGGTLKYYARSFLIEGSKYVCAIGAQTAICTWDGNRFHDVDSSAIYHHYDEGRRIGKARPFSCVTG